MRSTEEKHSSDFLYTSVSTPPTELNTHYKQRIKHTLQTKNILGTFLYTHSHIHTCVHSSIHRRETMYTHTNTHVYAHIYLHRTHSICREHILQRTHSIPAPPTRFFSPRVPTLRRPLVPTKNSQKVSRSWSKVIYIVKS